MAPPRGSGRPRKKPGHAGHSGPEDACPACRFRRARLSLGLTQAELAVKLKKHARTIRRWETVGPAEPDALQDGAPELQLVELLARVATASLLLGKPATTVSERE